MKKVASFLLKKYASMSGDKKVRIALEISECIRKLNKLGILTKTSDPRLKYLLDL